jgi:hypothetical protein
VIVHNFAEFLRLQYPDESIFVDGWKDVYPDNLPDRLILVKDTTGGTPQKFTNIINPHLIQLLVRDIDNVRAYNLANQIYLFLKDKLYFWLPAINLNGMIYPTTKIQEIVANATPQSMGLDSNSRAIYSTNYRLFYELGV